MKAKKPLIITAIILAVCGIFLAVFLFYPSQSPAPQESSASSSSEYVKPDLNIPDVGQESSSTHTLPENSVGASAPEILLENPGEKQTNLADSPIVRDDVVLPKQGEPEDPGE